jgi:hypothetical protein
VDQHVARGPAGLDRACIEKERDGQKWIKALYVVDGATIRPNLDERGAYFHPDCYVQIVDGLPEADVRHGGPLRDDGQPAVRRALARVRLQPARDAGRERDRGPARREVQRRLLHQGLVPEGILHLGEEIDPELVDAFRLYWLNEIQGRPHAFPIIGGSKAPEFCSGASPTATCSSWSTSSGSSRRCARSTASARRSSAQIDDVNRSTAEDSSESDDQKGILPLAELVKNMINLEIIGELGLGLGDYLEFAFGSRPARAPSRSTTSFSRCTSGAWPRARSGATRTAWTPTATPTPPTATDGLQDAPQGDGTPLPSREDADVAGLSAQQDREDQAAQDERDHADQTAADGHAREMEAKQADADAAGGEASPTPWQPADPDDPDTQAAMASHDDEQGIGPRNVRKTGREVCKAGNFDHSDHDRNPPMTKAEDDLVAVFDRATDRLVTGLSEILTHRGGRS